MVIGMEKDAQKNISKVNLTRIDTDWLIVRKAIVMGSVGWLLALMNGYMGDVIRQQREYMEEKNLGFRIV